MTDSKGITTSRSVMYISFAIVLLFVIFGMFLPKEMGKVASATFAFLTTDFGWLYLLAVGFFTVFIYAIAFSRFGLIKLGKDDDQPEFQQFSVVFYAVWWRNGHRACILVGS